MTAARTPLAGVFRLRRRNAGIGAPLLAGILDFGLLATGPDSWDGATPPLGRIRIILADRAALERREVRAWILAPPIPSLSITRVAQASPRADDRLSAVGRQANSWYRHLLRPSEANGPLQVCVGQYSLTDRGRANSAFGCSP